MVQANTPTKAAARKSRATKASSRQTTKASSAGSTRSMSVEHKQALAVGRQEGRTIRQYLEALQAHRPRRGRRRGAESIQRRLQQIDYDLPHADALSRIQLLQEQMDLQSELQSRTDTVDLAALEEEFVKTARTYSERKGISYSAWRQVGVPPSLLARAGIARTRSRA